MVRFSHAQILGPANSTGSPEDDGFQVIHVIPRPQTQTAPEYVPEPIAANYIEAMDNLARKSFTSAGMMFRRVLQRATTALSDDDPSSFVKLTLQQRVNKLARDRLITDAMRDWADIIRLEGNSANHDEEELGQDEFTSYDASQLHRFTELFLIYAFTLPEKVRLYRHQSDSQT